MYYVVSLAVGKETALNESELLQYSTGKAKSSIVYTSDRLSEVSYGEQLLNLKLSGYANKHTNVSLQDIRQLTDALPSLSELMVQERHAA